jgi:SpoVK/Ycf46/Vps4 family AAA+-type ATPase
LPGANVIANAIISEIRKHNIAECLLDVFQPAFAEQNALGSMADLVVIEDVDLIGRERNQIEPALASRPGRIDQAIEFPLPDEEGRA